MCTKRLFIYCAGGLGRDVLRLARQINRDREQWTELTFVDDACLMPAVNGARVLRFEQYLEERDKERDEWILAVGETVYRRILWKRLTAYDCSLTTLVHPGVYLDERDSLAQGCVLTEGTILGGGHSFGVCSYVNLGCLLGHNASLGAFSSLSPGCIVSGDVTIGDDTYIGTGAVIRNEIHIGKNCIVGMGSLVTRDIPDNTVAYGSPCKVVRENSNGMVFR